MAVKKVLKRRGKAKSAAKARSPKKTRRAPKKPSAPMVFPSHLKGGKKKKTRGKGVKKVQVAQVPAPITLDDSIFSGFMNGSSNTPRVALNFKSPLAMPMPMGSPMFGLPPNAVPGFTSPIGALPKGSFPGGNMHLMLPGGLPSPDDMLSDTLDRNPCDDPTNQMFNFLPPSIMQQNSADEGVKTEGKKGKKMKFTIPKDPLQPLDAAALGFDLATLGNPAQATKSNCPVPLWKTKSFGCQIAELEKMHQAQFPGMPPLFGNMPPPGSKPVKLTKVSCRTHPPKPSL